MREDRERARGLVTRCFDHSDLEYLQQQPQFQKAFAEMVSLDDFENTIVLAVYLFDERNVLNRGPKSFHPFPTQDRQPPVLSRAEFGGTSSPSGA
jgi:hypothetical protein